jgi:hypothetical protein
MDTGRRKVAFSAIPAQMVSGFCSTVRDQFNFERYWETYSIHTDPSTHCSFSLAPVLKISSLKTSSVENKPIHLGIFGGGAVGGGIVQILANKADYL